MPWTCNQCENTIASDLEPDCPECGSAKTSWTLPGAGTRLFVLARKKVEPLAGVERAPQPEDSDPLAVETVPAQHAVAMHWLDADRLLNNDQRPASKDLLYMRVTPRGCEREVTLTALFARQEARGSPHQGPEALDDAGTFTIPFLLLYGTDLADHEDLAFEGVTLIDVSEEDTELGYAPHVEVSAVKIRPLRLPVRPNDAYWVIVEAEHPDELADDVLVLTRADGTTEERTLAEEQREDWGYAVRFDGVDGQTPFDLAIRIDGDPEREELLLDDRVLGLDREDVIVLDASCTDDDFEQDDDEYAAEEDEA